MKGARRKAAGDRHDEPDMLYVISPEEQNRETLTEILTAHPEIKFVSFMGVDFAGNDTDEKVLSACF